MPQLRVSEFITINPSQLKVGEMAGADPTHDYSQADVDTIRVLDAAGIMKEIPFGSDRRAFRIICKSAINVADQYVHQGTVRIACPASRQDCDIIVSQGAYHSRLTSLRHVHVTLVSQGSSTFGQPGGHFTTAQLALTESSSLMEHRGQSGGELLNAYLSAARGALRNVVLCSVTAEGGVQLPASALGSLLAALPSCKQLILQCRWNLTELRRHHFPFEVAPGLALAFSNAAALHSVHILGAICPPLAQREAYAAELLQAVTHVPGLQELVCDFAAPAAPLQAALKRMPQLQHLSVRGTCTCSWCNHATGYSPQPSDQAPIAAVPSHQQAAAEDVHCQLHALSLLAGRRSYAPRPTVPNHASIPQTQPINIIAVRSQGPYTSSASSGASDDCAAAAYGTSASGTGSSSGMGSCSGFGSSNGTGISSMGYSFAGSSKGYMQPTSSSSSGVRASHTHGYVHTCMHHCIGSASPLTSQHSNGLPQVASEEGSRGLISIHVPPTDNSIASQDVGLAMGMLSAALREASSNLAGTRSTHTDGRLEHLVSGTAAVKEPGLPALQSAVYEYCPSRTAALHLSCPQTRALLAALRNVDRLHATLVYGGHGLGLLQELTQRCATASAATVPATAMTASIISGATANGIGSSSPSIPSAHALMRPAAACTFGVRMRLNTLPHNGAGMVGLPAMGAHGMGPMDTLYPGALPHVRYMCMEFELHRFATAAYASTGPRLLSAAASVGAACCTVQVLWVVQTGQALADVHVLATLASYLPHLRAVHLAWMDAPLDESQRTAALLHLTDSLHAAPPSQTAFGQSISHVHAPVTLHLYRKMLSMEGMTALQQHAQGRWTHHEDNSSMQPGILDVDGSAAGDAAAVAAVQPQASAHMHHVRKVEVVEGRGWEGCW